MRDRFRGAAKYGSVLLFILVISLFHYQTSTEYRYLHEIYQRVYYIPILLAAFWYGPGGGILAATLTSLIYINHIQREWAQFPAYTFNQYAEIILYFVVAVIIGSLAQRERKERKKSEATSQELAQAYEKLQQTFDQLKQTDRLAALGTLSAGVAHEIRNPLGAIKGSVEILEKAILPQHPKREFLDIIKEETVRLNSIVSEFLKFARPPQLHLESTSMSELIDSTMVFLEKEARQSRVEIIAKKDSPIPPLQLDPDQIRQVLLNVMLNGIQAMPEGGTLEVRSRLDHENAVVEICDTGEGADEVELGHLFDPFFTTKPQGTGLGLSISYQLVQSHGGKITVQKNALRGLTFRIDLPISDSLDLGTEELN